MEAFAKLPTDDRKPYLEQAGAAMRIRPQLVEKDFWVCWTLRLLFALSGIGEHLIFKGGTSLSKAYRIIQRFSEDIDITISREFLGFGGNHDPERAPTRSQQRVWLNDLKTSCQHFVATELLLALRERVRDELRTGEFALSIDPADADAQTILFQYPSCWAELPMSYIGHSVKLELGARSDSWPSEHIAIRPYVAEQIPNAFQSGECGVNVLTKERTFWEKVALLHEENFRATDKPIKPRMSRHYSDLARMIDLGSADVALNETGLLDRVVAHRRVFFRHSWVDYDLMKRGTFQVVPRSSRVAEWEADYKQMEEMFFEKPPDFKNVLETIRQFETKLNSV